MKRDTDSKNGALLGRPDRLELVESYLADVRPLILETIRGMLPAASDCWAQLYEPMLDYPQRMAKGLRPALCIAACRGFGGQLEAVLPSAAVIELYHNAFLIHDDIEDRSELRRGAATLHAELGMPIAVNVGDAMLATALGPLLDNMRTIGMGKALRVLRSVAEFARESVEGQAIELEWIRGGDFGASDRDYLTMVDKKTSQYSFVAPLVIGAIVAGAAGPDTDLRSFGTTLGAAFQITDDVLNLLPDDAGYGKEMLGDLWEGKHTIVLLHAMRNATAAERSRMVQILAKPRGRPGARVESLAGSLGELHSSLRAIDPELAERCGAVRDELEARAKRPDEIEYLMAIITRCGSLEYASALAAEWAKRARGGLADICERMPDSAHRRFIEGLVSYVVVRQR